MVSIFIKENFSLRIKIYLIYFKISYFYRYPEPITRVKNSSYILSQLLVDYWHKDRDDYIKGIIRNGLGIEDFEDYSISWLNETHTQLEYEIFLANMTNFKAQLGV